MFFILSKIFWSLVQPLNAICLLAGAGALASLRWEQAGRRILKTALALLLVLGLLPVGPVMMVWLERKYPLPELPETANGIIVLGGAFESNLTKENGLVSANDNIERLICFQELAQKYPDAKLVYSGGAGDILNPGAMEGDDARAYFKITGLNREIIYEEKSRNTFENALYTKELVKPESGDNWIVVTSAYHMPRTVGIFEKQGWALIPYGCDRRTTGRYSDAAYRLPNVAGNFVMLNLAFKEIIGGVIYYMTGKSAFILP